MSVTRPILSVAAFAAGAAACVELALETEVAVSAATATNAVAAAKRMPFRGTLLGFGPAA
jgi:hypothetical protein